MNTQHEDPTTNRTPKTKVALILLLAILGLPLLGVASMVACTTLAASGSSFGKISSSLDGAI